MKGLKNILFALLMLMIGLPIFQRTVPVFQVAPLKGAYTIPQKPTASLKSVWEGKFQEDYNNYFEHTIGFRPWLVRINNQLSFSLFDTATAKGVIIGKESYLYEYNYIKAYKGWDYLGKETIDSITREAVALNKKLAEAGKLLLFVFEPGKATFFPEFIPDKYMSKPSGENTNYAELTRTFAREGLQLMDVNGWFVKMKDTVSYPLYSQTGIHWSAYGVALSLDSLIRRIEAHLHIDMIEFGWKGFDEPDTLRSPDNDIADGMNLLWNPPHYRMAYPRLYFGPGAGKTKPNVITVADSYYWNIFGTGYASRLFEEHSFWYYNEQVFSNQWPDDRKPADLDLGSMLSKADVVIVMATEANLYRFPYGFVHDALTALQGRSLNSNIHQSADANEVREKGIAEVIAYIESDAAWKQQIQDKAIARKISYSEMLQLDAEWVWEQKNK